MRRARPSRASLRDINGRHLEVAAGSAQAETLRRLRVGFPDLAWVERSRGDSLDLLGDVQQGLIDYTIVDSTEFALGRNFHSGVRVGFDLMPGESLARAMKSAMTACLGGRGSSSSSIWQPEQLRLRGISSTSWHGGAQYGLRRRARSFSRDVQSLLPCYRAVVRRIMLAQYRRGLASS